MSSTVTLEEPHTYSRFLLFCVFHFLTFRNRFWWHFVILSSLLLVWCFVFSYLKYWYLLYYFVQFQFQFHLLSFDSISILTFSACTCSECILRHAHTHAHTSTRINRYTCPYFASMQKPTVQNKQSPILKRAKHSNKTTTLLMYMYM